MIKNLIITFLFFPLTLHAQEIIEPATTMNVGEFQAQLAVIYSENNEASFRESEIAYNNTLLLYGVVPNLELRLGIDAVASQIRNNGILTEKQRVGTTPLLIGAKYRFVQQTEDTPEISIMSHAYFPITASRANKSDNVGYDLWLLALHQLNEKHAFLSNLGVFNDGNSQNILPVYAIGHSWFPNDKWGFNTEIYGEFPSNDVGQHFFDLGLSHFFKPHIQLDLNVGRGINNNQTILGSLRLTYTVLNNNS